MAEHRVPCLRREGESQRLTKYARAMNENKTTDHQRYRKIQDDIEGFTEVSGLRVERSRGDE